MPKPDFSFEIALMETGKSVIAGIDEVGRGALAGPVAVAAVVLDVNALPQGLDDSKKLSANQRETLYEIILRDAHAVSITFGPAQEIDRINIRQATLRAMTRAALSLALKPDFALIDGRDIPPGLPCPAGALIKGDERSLSIAAASIVAKVTRDRLMMRLDRTAPAYGFARHVGYGTAIHLAAIRQFNPSPYHRLSFAPMKA